MHVESRSGCVFSEREYSKICTRQGLGGFRITRLQIVKSNMPALYSESGAGNHFHSQSLC